MEKMHKECVKFIVQIVELLLVAMVNKIVLTNGIDDIVNSTLCTER